MLHTARNLSLYGHEEHQAMQVQSMTRLEKQNRINFLLLTSPYVCPYLVCYLMITSRVLNLNELVARPASKL